MTRLHKIGIEGYRTLKTAEIELGPLNVLIGANGAGKSNFLSFFKMLNEIINGRLQQFIGTSGRADSLLHFGPKVTPELKALLKLRRSENDYIYGFKLKFATTDTLFFAEEKSALLRSDQSSSPLKILGAGHLESRLVGNSDERNDSAKVIRAFLSHCRVYQFSDTSVTARGRQYGYIQDNRSLSADASNLAALLFAYREREKVAYHRIVSTIRKILPEFGDFDLEPSRLNPNEILLNWRSRNRDYLFGPHQISDGSLRAMAICTLFLQPEADLPDIILLDEPELGLHPHALEIVAGLIRAASIKTQVIVATQSQSFLDYFEPDEIITVEARDGQSIFRRLEAEPLEEWLEDYSLGELWQRNVLGAGPLP